MNIGERIRSRRIELNMSQDELAKKLGYKSRSSINKIELGGNQLTQSKIKAIADALDTTPSWIMGWTDVGNVTDYILNHPDQYDQVGSFLVERQKAERFYKKYLECPAHIRRTIDDLLEMGGDADA